MKKIIIAMLIMTMSLLAFAGCGSGTEEERETTATVSTIINELQFEDYDYVKTIECDLGPDISISEVGLSTEGEVIARIDSDLANKYAPVDVLAIGVKDLYVEEFGNGGYSTVVMIKEDGTVSALNISKLYEDKVVEVMDNLGGYQDVVSVEGTMDVDAHLINVVTSNGEKYLLDPYLQ